MPLLFLVEFQLRLASRHLAFPERIEFKDKFYGISTGMCAMMSAAAVYVTSRVCIEIKRRAACIIIKVMPFAKSRSGNCEDGNPKLRVDLMAGSRSH